MNTTAQIARLRAEAEEMEARAWDKRAEAWLLKGNRPRHYEADGYAVSCRERAASYILDAEKAEKDGA